MATLLNPGAAATEAAELQRALEPNPGKFQWDFALIIGAFHLGAVLAFFAFRWSALAVFAVTWVLTQNIGIGLSYHRLLTHRGYVVPKWLEYTIATMGNIVLQGRPGSCVRAHRLQHASS